MNVDHYIVTADEKPGRITSSRSTKAYLMCSCASFLKPVAVKSSVLVCVESGRIAGSVTWVTQGDGGMRAVVSRPQGLGQMNLDL